MPLPKSPRLVVCVARSMGVSAKGVPRELPIIPCEIESIDRVVQTLTLAELSRGQRLERVHLARARRSAYATWMRKVTTNTVFACSPATYWEIFFDDAYSRRLYLEGLSFRAYEQIEKTPTSRIIKVTPTMNIPGALEKLIGNTFSYEQHGTLDAEKGIWRWQMKPQPPMKDKLFTEGTIRIEAAGEGQCRRIDEVSIEAKIFGLGGMIESTAEKETRAGNDKEKAFFTRWLSEKSK